jgi:hypothetical protein
MDVLHCSTLFYTVVHWSTLFCTILHCSALLYTILHCSALFYTILHYYTLFCTVRDYSTLFYTILHSSTLFYTILHCYALFYNILHCSALFCTVLHCSTPFYIILHCLHCSALFCTVLHYSTQNHANNRRVTVINNKFSGSRYNDGHKHFGQFWFTVLPCLWNMLLCFPQMRCTVIILLMCDNEVFFVTTQYCVGASLMRICCKLCVLYIQYLWFRQSKRIISTKRRETKQNPRHDSL